MKELKKSIKESLYPTTAPNAAVATVATTAKISTYTLLLASLLIYFTSN
jgi:hypothetical protein